MTLRRVWFKALGRFLDMPDGILTRCQIFTDQTQADVDYFLAEGSYDAYEVRNQKERDRFCVIAFDFQGTEEELLQEAS